MQMSINTNYTPRDKQGLSQSLENIAKAGFTHILWCHDAGSNHLYSQKEISQFKKWLNEYGLQLLDTHGSLGKGRYPNQEKSWFSNDEKRRLAGIELVKNRIDMTANLAGEILIMHSANDPNSEPLHKSLAEILPYAAEKGIPIALENSGCSLSAIHQTLASYPPQFLGLCYDSAHGNRVGDGIENLKLMKDRLISVHIGDSTDDAVFDHLIPFTGTTRWDQIAQIMAQSSYKRCISMELHMSRSGIEDEALFLKEAYQAGEKLANLIEKFKSK